jgi:capsular polysaccharide biosynthesis protein
MRREGSMSHTVRLALAVVVLTAMAAYLVSLWQRPTYETSARVLVSFGEHDGQPRPIPKRFVPLLPFPQETVAATRSRPVAEETIRRLELEASLSSDELLDNLTVEQVENTSFIVLTYEDTDPVRARRVVNTVGEVASERVSNEKVASEAGQLTVTVVAKAAVLPYSAASPHPFRNGLLTLVAGLVLVGLWAFVSSRRREA